MIIGISGRKGSGKDLVAEIIQRLQVDNDNIIFNRKYGTSRVDDSVYELISGDKRYIESEWEIKRFADKLKDMVCMLIGCTREQLEDREFKEKELGEEWQLLRETSSYGAPDQIYPVDYKGMIHIVHTSKETLTPRKILQLLGTEAGRDIIHPNIWVNSLMSEYKPIYQTEGEIDNYGISITSKDFPNWLIPDLRFPNELKAIEDRKGITIRIERPDLPEDNHPSETALDDAEFDYIIENSGTVEDLIEMVEDLLKNEKIIK